MNRLMSTCIAVVLVLAAFAQCQGQEGKPGPDYEQLKAMEWIIGDWEAEWVVPAGDAIVLDGYPVGAKIKSYCSYAWRENKNYIELTFRDELNGKVLHRGFELVGVDPQSKKIVHWLYSVLGGCGTGEWSVEGKTWTLTWSYKAGDGMALEGIGIHVLVDANTYTWLMKDTKMNGKKMPDSEVITYRRLAK